MFGAPGSTACTLAAKANNTTAVVGTHCLLSGPDDNMQDLIAGLPHGVTQSQGQLLTVQQGTVVLQAANQTAGKTTPFNSPSAQFYVLRDHVSLFGNDITNPQQSTDQSGSPDVSFGFTSTGAKAFQNVTAAIARRGDLVSGLGQTFDQHFAVALDTQLITVPSIDFKTYPDGIPGDNGAQITGGFTIQSAQDLATQLRLGALPIQLKLIRANRTSIGG
jgi:preprotein translocase subunit SecD